MRLGWDSKSGIDKYWVEYRTSSGEPWVTDSDEIAGTASGYSATGLSPNTTYFFRVSAYGDGTTFAAEWSSTYGTDSATTDPLPLPDTPTGLNSTTGDGTITLTWDRADNATGYEVQQWYGVGPNPRFRALPFYDATTGSFFTVNGSISPIDISGTIVTVGGLTNGANYVHRIRATNISGVSGWAQKDTDLPLAPPTSFDVTPMPLRKAELSWGAVSGPGSIIYDVQVSESPSGSWTDVPSGTSDTNYEINLDAVLGLRGLADATSFEFQVRARQDGTSDFDSAYSEIVTIIDTPIIAANGRSPNQGPENGQAKLSWRTMANVLGDSSYFGGTYSFRFRKAGGIHNQLAWEPGTYVTDTTVDESELVDGNTIGGSNHGLTKEAIYAIQLIYEKNNKPKVFATRDVFVWPSDRPAGGGERIATFPLNYPWPNKTFSYVICEETFPMTKRDEWKTFITHAFSQWDLATDSLVTTERLDSEDCADYSEFVDEVVTDVKSFAQSPRPPVGIPPTDAEIAAHATALLENFDQSRIKSTREDFDERLNEVFMLNDSSANAVTVDAFKEISSRVGHGWCGYACTSFPTPPLNTVDISFRGSLFQISDLDVPGADDTADAGEIRFNSCESVVNEYGVVVHEAGHALGITGGIDGSRFDDGQGQFHPRRTTIIDSVMSYGRNPSVSCSPSPLDVMAIYALYQDR